MAWSEIYTSLATGVIDGSIGSNMIDHRDGNHVEAAKHMHPSPLAGAQSTSYSRQSQSLEQAPSDLKAIVKAATAVRAIEQLTKSKDYGNLRLLLRWKQKD
ncbi:hypothetical protein P4S72_22435 [Vibrio sp. PP-XX7]